MKKLRGAVSSSKGILHKGCHEGASGNCVGRSTTGETKVERALENDTFRALHACWF